ncbi:MAG: hypothetical protein K9G62_06670 [Alphaproteobacteria bacterium]|nr:hypothetical protein [Alphaproteobacteria bacterium]
MRIAQFIHYAPSLRSRLFGKFSMPFGKVRRKAFGKKRGLEIIGGVLINTFTSRTKHRLLFGFVHPEIGMTRILNGFALAVVAFKKGHGDPDRPEIHPSPPKPQKTRELEITPSG